MPTKTRARCKAPAVPDIIRGASQQQRNGWMDAAGGQAAPIAGTIESFIPAMYQAWGAYGYQPAITWYQLANMYVSWEYTATEKIARTIASLPAQLFRYENTQGKTIKPYHIKSLTFGDVIKNKTRAEIAWKLKKDHGIRRIEIDEHPFLDLVSNPNADMVRFNFWRMLCIHLELDGAVGVYKAKADVFGNPQELHILPATWTGQFKPVPATNGVDLIKAFRLLDQDINTEFSKEEIIWLHYTSLRNPFEGMSSLKAQLYAFNMDQYLMQQVNAFYKNGAMFSNVFSTESQLTQKQYNEIAAQLQNYQGAKNAGQKFVLHSGLKMEKPLNATARESMIDEIERMARDKLLSGHDISAGKIGLTEQQNRSNLEVVDMGFFNEAIKPRAMLITEYFDRFLVKNYDENLDFEFDYPHFQDRAQDITERQSNIVNGITTRNEERDKMGLEPVEGGDVILVSPMNVPLSSVASPAPEEVAPEGSPVAGTENLKPEGQLGDEEVAGGTNTDKPGSEKPQSAAASDDQVPPKPDFTPGEPQKSKKVAKEPTTSLPGTAKSGSGSGSPQKVSTSNDQNKVFWTPDKKLAAWKAFDREAQAYEPLFKRVAVQFFKDTGAQVQDALEKHGVKIKSHIGAMGLNGRQKWLAANKARLDEFVPSKAAMKKKLKADMKPVYLSVIDKAGNKQLKELSKLVKKKTKDIEADVEMEFDLNDPRVQKWLGGRLEEFSETTSQTTIDAVKKVLREGFEDGEPLMKMGESLREYFTGAETYRANLIARTESTAAMNEGDLESVNQMGLGDAVGKIWLNEPDARDTHQAAGERYGDGYDKDTSEPMTIDKEFEVGEDTMLFPAGGSLGEENCNCRCGMVYEMLSPEDAGTGAASSTGEEENE